MSCFNYGAGTTFNLGPDRLGAGLTWAGTTVAGSTWGRNDWKTTKRTTY